MSCESDEVKKYEQQLLREAENDWILNNNDVVKRCDMVNFISSSNGKNRNRRKNPRDVSLFGYDGQYTSKIDGDATGILDRLAFQGLEHLPIEERTADNLIETVEQIKEIKTRKIKI